MRAISYSKNSDLVAIFCKHFRHTPEKLDPIYFLYFTAFCLGSRCPVVVAHKEVIADSHPSTLRHIDFPNIDELFSHEECFYETVASSEIVEIRILYDRFKEIMCIGKKSGREYKSFDFEYTLFTPRDIFEVSSSDLGSQVLVIKILLCKASIMKECCKEEVSTILWVYPLSIGEMAYARIDIERVIDVMIGIVIDRIEEAYNISEGVVEYFLFIYHVWEGL